MSPALCALFGHTRGLMKMDRMPYSREVVYYVCCSRCGERAK